jgi:cellulose synthase operon protein C
MKCRTKCLLYVSIISGMCSASGCFASPEARKQNFVKRGDLYFEKGKYREAAIMYQNAVQIDGTFAPAHFKLAQTYLSEANWQGAYAEAARTVELSPTNWKAQVILGNLFLRSGQYQNARDRAEIVLKGDPRSAEAQVLLSSADARAGSLPKAIQEAQKAILMDPGRSASYLNLALLQERDRDSRAAESFHQALSLDPKSMDAILAFGDFCATQKKWADARKEYQAAITLEPQDLRPRDSLAHLYLSKGRKEMAEEVARETKTQLKNNPLAYRMLGDFYISQRETDKALAEFSSLYSEHPHDLGVAKTYTQLLLLKKQVKQAALVDDDILRHDRADRDGLILRGQIFIEQGRPNDAVRPLEQAITEASNDAAAHYLLGLAYRDTSKLDPAEAEWREAAQLQPRMVEAQRGLASVASRIGDTSLLAESANKLIELEPRAAEGYIFHAMALAKQSNLSAAEADLKKAIKFAPDSAEAYARMGELRLAEKHYDEAEKFDADALQRDPSLENALTGLVSVDLHRKQPEKALQVVKNQLARVPNNSSLYVLLGYVQLQNENPTRAQEAFEKATEVDKNNVQAFLLLAGVQLSLGLPDQAVSTYERALQANPFDVRVHLSFGRLLETRGEWQRAEDLYQKALQIQPDYAPAANSLASLMLQHGGDMNVALTLAQTARHGLPDLPNTADTLGWAYYRNGVYNAAVDLLEQALKGDPHNPTYHYHLGMAYLKANKYAMARKQLEYTLQISPSCSEAGEIRKLLDDTSQKN